MIMSTEQTEMIARGDCPMCAALITPSAGVEETEILRCPECQSMLVVDEIKGYRLSLSEAPRIEEDWGE